MYRNLCPTSLGITGRQSELIELALTYGFEGIDLDIQHFTKQIELHGLDHAARFLRSAQLKIGPFDLPVRWDGEEDVFRESLDQVRGLLAPAAEIGAKACYVTVQPASDTLPYHENFEFHRERVSKLAELLATYDMRLGLTFLAASNHREERPYQFIASPDALLTLIKTTVASNLGLLVDLWQWRVGGGTIEQLRELAPEQIVMVRLADAPDDVPFESVTDKQRLMPGSTGMVDCVGALRVLGEIGYKGPVAPYPHPSQLKGQTRDRIVQRTADMLDKLWKEADLVKTASHVTSASGSI